MARLYSLFHTAAAAAANRRRRAGTVDDSKTSPTSQTVYIDIVLSPRTRRLVVTLPRADVATLSDLSQFLQANDSTLIASGIYIDWAAKPPVILVCDTNTSFVLSDSKSHLLSTYNIKDGSILQLDASK
jgi:hypothetical protein